MVRWVGCDATEAVELSQKGWRCGFEFESVGHQLDRADSKDCEGGKQDDGSIFTGVSGWVHGMYAWVCSHHENGSLSSGHFFPFAHAIGFR